MSTRLNHKKRKLAKIKEEDNEETIIYHVAPDQITKGVVLSFHGGNFTGGSVKWDKKQNEFLNSLGFEVHQLAFPQNSIFDFYIWMLLPEMRRKLERLNHEFNGNVYLLGRSSGGYLAKLFWELYGQGQGKGLSDYSYQRGRNKKNSKKGDGLIKKAIYLCPVFNPCDRFKFKPQFAQNTQRFFTHDTKLTRLWIPLDTTKCFLDPKIELLVLATEDENVPSKCFTGEQLTIAKYLGPKSHTGILGCCSLQFGQMIINFLS